ncbi:MULTISPECIES: ABC transporter ATP-binding protein [unclassified Chelatococcus]|uniref:ABC transporter ATP-binding protein n=1 Tax=unclassified Chelatococcus TaxID=2638111 RepID=UPI001BCE8B7A|nr:MULTISPECIES: ABC transporter ATP-binding protein [unclassified Chelatococcus]MBS7698545.1 ABC transporter ATP-binding protein [Chelatococcus sp. YT9]MBX3554804.1 ABC transporter ATP-binding protein [Chelatococcus sp.]
MNEILKVSSLSCGYSRVPALHAVDLVVEAGSIVSVVGPNGAGKTTMLNALMGLHPSTGRVTFQGRDISAAPAEARLEAGLCLIAEKRELFGTMSVEDNLRLGAFVRRREGGAAVRRSLQEVFERFPRLQERRAQLAGTLSGGERQMLAIGRAMMSSPKLLMMDEPSLGLAPRIVEEMFTIIQDLRAAGVSILLVEQNARGALAISDQAYVLELGEVVMQGASRDLQNDPRIVEAYLGIGAAA